MAEDLSPSDIRARKFSVVRRGLDRGEVAGFLDRVADRVKSLEGELSSITGRLNQLGITDLVDLKEEVEDVGLEIQSILDAAMEAAEGLRARAAADAEEQGAEADGSAFSVREGAWIAGTHILEDASSQAGRMVAEAREDALFIRAQAEQDAKGLVSQARREADDMLRSSREEGERIVVVARAESDSILAEANRAAEKAQERARVLENRRVELLNELQEAESTIRDGADSPSESGSESDGTVRVIAKGSDERTHWPEDEGAVRVLPAEPAVPIAAEPVDAEAMAAEVEMMRNAVTMPQPVEPEEALEPGEPPAPDNDVEDQPIESAAEADEEPTSGRGSEPIEPPDGAEEVLPERPDQVKKPEVAEEPVEPEVAVEPVEPVEEAAKRQKPAEDRVTVVDDDPAIDDLFAKLRRSVDESLAQPEANSEAPPEPQPAPDLTETAAVVPALYVVSDVEPDGDFERRDRLLLPIENRGLRGLKRRIVELQNRVLEELRQSSGEWRLGREHVAETMGEELDAVLTDSYQAGHAMAAEVVGEPEPQLIGGPHQGAAEAFTADLHRDAQSVIEKGDPGSRRLVADVGRVFRNWRTDEAERHVRDAARRAFNDGLLAGYSRLGVSTVGVVAPGKPCGQCSAGTGLRWDPAEELPSGATIPPAGPGCAGMIAPTAVNGSNSQPAQ